MTEEYTIPILGGIAGGLIKEAGNITAAVQDPRAVIANTEDTFRTYDVAAGGGVRGKVLGVSAVTGIARAGEAIAKTDILTGQPLTGDEIFDRSVAGTGSLLGTGAMLGGGIIGSAELAGYRGLTAATASAEAAAASRVKVRIVGAAEELPATRPLPKLTLTQEEAASLPRSPATVVKEIASQVSRPGQDVVGAVEGVIRAKQPHVISESRFAELAKDPAKAGKITAGSKEEVRTGLAAERAGKIDPITTRGIPGQPGEAGFEFTTKGGTRYDVKAFRANSLATPAEVREFALKLKADPKVKILVDPRNLTDSELTSVIDRAVAAGVDRARFVVVPRSYLEAPIHAGGKVY